MMGRPTVGCLFLALGLVLPDPCRAQATPEPQLERARRIMREVPLIDGHNDLPWELRTRFRSDFDSLDIAQPQPGVRTDIPRLRRGLVGGQFWSTWVPPSYAGRGAARIGMEQVDLVHRMIARYPAALEFAGTADDVMRIHRQGRVASLIGLEGGYPIENSLGLLRSFYREGVRYMTLTHSENTDWADASTDTPEHGGLTRFGEEVVREMNRLGMLVDLSHVSDSTVWDALRVSEAPVIFSHSAARYLSDHPRNVPDDIARAVATKGGIIMVNFHAPFASPAAVAWEAQRDRLVADWQESGVGADAVRDSARAWTLLNPMPPVTLGTIADHIEHLRRVAGADHVGIGSDLDGNVPPQGLEDVSTFPDLVAELLRRGWAEGDVKKLIGRNILRVMHEVEAVAVRLQRARPPSTATIEELDTAAAKP